MTRFVGNWSPKAQTVQTKTLVEKVSGMELDGKIVKKLQKSRSESEPGQYFRRKKTNFFLPTESLWIIGGPSYLCATAQHIEELKMKVWFAQRIEANPVPNPTITLKPLSSV